MSTNQSIYPLEEKSTILPYMHVVEGGKSNISTSSYCFEDRAKPTSFPGKEDEKEEDRIGAATINKIYPKTRVHYTFSDDYSTHRTKRKIDEAAQLIIRKHFASRLLKNLILLKDNAKSPRASVFIDSIFKIVKSFRDISPYDPFLDFIMALNNAIILKNRWIDYNSEQYEKAIEILGQLLKRDIIKDKNVEKAISNLDEIGFDILPFEMDEITVYIES